MDWTLIETNTLICCVETGMNSPQNKTHQAGNLEGNLGTMGVTAWPHPTPLLLRLLGGWRVGPPCNHWHRPAPRHWGPGRGPNSCDPTAFSRPRHCRGRSRGPTLGAPKRTSNDLVFGRFVATYSFVSRCPVHFLFSSLWFGFMIWIICKRPAHPDDADQLQKHCPSWHSSSSKPAHPNNRTGRQKSCPNFQNVLQMKFHIGLSSLEDPPS